MMETKYIYDKNSHTNKKFESEYIKQASWLLLTCTLVIIIEEKIYIHSRCICIFSIHTIIYDNK